MKISVLMGIYNCAETLGDAIESILAQTVTDWELILCDDGSTDDTYAVATRFCEQHPDKIKLLQNPQNMGLNYTLNRCLEHATGTYIARMDGDDLCIPERFEKELQVLESRPEIAIVSTPMEYFDENGTWATGTAISEPQPRDFLHGTPFCHAPCMVRRQAMLSVGGYTDDKKFLRVEDYDLWIKLYHAGHRGINLSEALYRMRDDRNATARRKFRYRINEARVKAKAVRILKLPVWCYVYTLRPILVGLLPTPLYTLLHKKRLGS
ncbi:MAG: glycosyltransferase [Oscillospiraceae bacterium]|nr:glycosyltransferase [Oscillospiraceae bacterium]